MQSTDWAPAHSDALRQYLAKGMSYSEIADAINAKFKTTYSRSAALGRARRMGLGGPDQPKNGLRPPLSAKPPLLRRLRERYAAEFTRPRYRVGTGGQHHLTAACRGGMKRGPPLDAALCRRLSGARAAKPCFAI